MDVPKSTEGQIIQWTMITNKTKNPEAVFKCPKCNKESFVHLNYQRSGIIACVGRGGCNTLENVVKDMLRVRNWTFIKIEKLDIDGDSTIYFTCNNGHETNLKWVSLRKGASCKQCTTNGKKKTNKLVTAAVVRQECECTGSRGKGKPHACPHHNHLVCHPNSAVEWDYTKNYPVRPEQISPSCSDTYGWICSNENCNMSYNQIVAIRVGSQQCRCPFCANQAVSIQNCLSTTHPHISSDWDYKLNGNLKPTCVTSGSGKKAWWICRNKKHENDTDGVFRYESSIAHRTNGTGCPSCNTNGYEQRNGDQEEFVRKSREIHGDKYQYPEEYKGGQTKINIYCSILNDNGLVHGIFRQSPKGHKSGRGCSKCNAEKKESKKVAEVNKILTGIGYVENVTMLSEWNDGGRLKYKSVLRVDKFLINEKLIIEIDGSQHFEERKYHKNREVFLENLRRDFTKDKYCLENNISLLRIPYNMKDCKAWIEQTISMCRSGSHIYFSYRHYYDEIINFVNISNSIIIKLVNCPPLKFKENQSV